MNLRTTTAALATAGLLLGGTAAAASASTTSKTTGCRPAQHYGKGYGIISATATATPYADRWITRKVSVSATKRGHDASSYQWTLVGIKIAGYPTTSFHRSGFGDGNRVTKYLNSSPRDITITWAKDLQVPFTTKHVSCTIKGF